MTGINLIQLFICSKAEAFESQQRLLQALAEEVSGNEFLSIEDYAARYKMHEETVRQQCRLGILPGVKQGRRCVIEVNR